MRRVGLLPSWNRHSAAIARSLQCAIFVYLPGKLGLLCLIEGDTKEWVLWLPAMISHQISGTVVVYMY